MFRNMLLPLDGSRLAEALLPIVKRLAGKIPCSVKVLHVIEKRAPSTIHGDTHLRDVAGAQRYLDAVAQRLRQWGLEVTEHVHTVPQGDIPRCIAEHAEELEQDLIVLCTHGSGGIKRFVFGTNAEQVLMHGRTPVLLVNADANGNAPPFGPSSIVALLDRTSESAPVLTACAELAIMFDAALHLLYVVPTAGTVSAEQAPACVLSPSATRLVLDIEAEQTSDMLKKQIDSLLGRNIRAGGTVERGDAVAAVCGTARAKNADMVCMATRGLAGLGAFWANDLVPRIASSYDGTLLLFPAVKE
ncbi:MAG: universal stress protein [Desulfobacteraceae bacterium]|nr:universal stress protein [Desulfobacteraceae bacterium]